MSFWGPSIPMEYDSGTGFTMESDILGEIRQNLRMLLLTNPGERVMVPEFGVGMMQYLFRRFGEQTNSAIRTNIIGQVGRYLPVVKIDQILFDSGDRDGNILGVVIYYSIPSLGASDSIVITT